MVLGLVFVSIGLVLLTLSADRFVAAAARLAFHYQVSPVVVGAVLIGFGTSAPEMVVSGIAAAGGDLDIGVGNVIGSNVANVSLVLAAAAVIRVVPVESVTIRREVPISVASCLVFALLVQGEISRVDGLILAALIGIFLVGVLRTGSAEDLTFVDDVASIVEGPAVSIRAEAWRTAGGLLGVVLSAWLVVDGASRLAEAFGLSGGFVGFTLVALGTSAPELVTSVQAARQGETELLVGNLLGSNIFNSLAVGGVIGLVGPGPVLNTEMAETGSILMMVIVATSALFMVFGRSVGRSKAFILFFMWVIAVVLLS